MYIKRIAPFSLISIALGLTGCDTISDGRYSIFNERAQTVGANQLIPHESFERICLPSLLFKHAKIGLSDKFENQRDADSRVSIRSLISDQDENYVCAPPNTPEKIGADTDRAFAVFNQIALRSSGSTSGSEDVDRYRFLRNAVQDRIIAASVQRCQFYTRYLKRVDQSVNLFLGTLTTVAGAAGAITTGADASRTLSGLAALFSGTRAEFNEDLFAGLAIHVITKGLEEERAEKLKEIIVKRDESSNEQYTVEAAVYDALEFHGRCGLIDGLNKAGAALERVNNPGIKELFEFSEQFEETKNKLEIKRAELAAALEKAEIKAQQEADEAKTAAAAAAAKAAEAAAAAAAAAASAPPASVANASSDSEKAMSVADVLKIQLALCTTPDANFGTNTRKAIVDYHLVGNEQSERDKTSSELTQEDIDVLSKAGNCNTAVYRNAFERFKFNNNKAVKALKETLNLTLAPGESKLDAADVALDARTREVVKKVRAANKIAPEDSDAITPEFFEALTKIVEDS